MAKFFLCAVTVLLLFGCKTVGAKNSKHAILVFSLTKGYHHASIADGIIALKKMGAENGLSVDTTTSIQAFTKENLKKYNALVFLSPTGSNVFSNDQKEAIKQYVNNGGGIVGIHAATDFCYEWEWYGKMMGAFFEKHPKIQNAKLDVVMPDHIINKGLPQPWMHKDEWYNFKSVNPNIKVLIKIDETSYTGGSMKNNHPISWTNDFEGGKIFYTALGHTKECYTDPLFLGHVLAGLNWVMK